MPKPRESISVQCRYFSWLLSKRNGVWQADGRSNSLNAGRQSLGTKNEREAQRLVHELDEVQASKLGLIDRKPDTPKSGLTIVEGIELFRNFKSRPKSVGGVAPTTLGRYNRILKKFDVFVLENRIKFATLITVDLFNGYVELLESRSFALSTIVTEMTLLKSMHQFWIHEKKLDPRFGFTYLLRRPNQSSTYCPSKQEVDSILAICSENTELTWLYRIVHLLSHTGVRFGEARDLEWRDVDSTYQQLLIRDESLLKKTKAQTVRTTKSRKSRKIPIHSKLADILKSIPRTGKRILDGPRGGRLRNDVFGDMLREHVLPKVAKEVGNDDVMRLTAHGFRHFFVSKCANSGIPQMSVMTWLGHSTPRMTNYYYHSNEAASLSHMRQLEAAENSDHGDPENC